ncbi:MAG: hypothetical protein ABJN95_03495 [Maribacter sp.]|uniref:hypothetical protein n=1 Tax=Maribacter sp. TaxID=1897614 RepID=UPI003299B7E5
MKIIFVLLFVLCIVSCDSKSSDDNSFGTCDADGVFTDIQLAENQLLGIWKWTKSTCGFCSNPGVYEADKEVFASFKSDGSFSVSEDSKTIEEGIWTVRESENGSFISVDPKSTLYLGGSIRVCDREFISDSRPWDGPAYLFVKMD